MEQRNKDNNKKAKIKNMKCARLKNKHILLQYSKKSQTKKTKQGYGVRWYFKLVLNIYHMTPQTLSLMSKAVVTSNFKIPIPWSC
jgi:hypothetical protein